MRTYGEPRQVRHVDLAAGDLDALAAPGPAHEAERVVLWWRHLPLGHMELDGTPRTAGAMRTMAAAAVAPALGQRLAGAWFDPPLPERRPSRPRPVPPPVATLAGLERPLAGLDRPGGAPPPAPVDAVSVVVCTRDRPAELHRALTALARLDPAPAEVVVVDSAPRSDATAQVVASFPGVRRVVEQRPGLSRARNAGIAATTGEVVAFTDDDTEVWPTWAQHLAEALTQPEVMVVTGLVVPARLDSDGALLFEERLGGFGQGYRRRRFDRPFFEGMRRLGVPVWRIGAGANMAVRRRAFEEVGGFDERLGAGAAGCSEDSELWYRVLAAGGICRYEPAAVVAHHHREDLPAVRRQMRGYMRGHVTALAVQYAAHRNGGDLRRALVALPRWYARRGAGALLDPDPTLTAEVAGYLAGLARIPGVLRPRRTGGRRLRERRDRAP